jgi:hypothetical protein
MKILSQEEQQQLSLERAKQHLRISGNNDDALIEDFISSAVAKAEQVTGRSLVEREYQIEEVNSYGNITIPMPPTATIDKVEYYDGDEWVELTANTEYAVYGITTLSVAISTFYRLVRIEFTSDVYDNADLRRLMYELIGVWYDNRPDVEELEHRIVSKIAKYKLWQAE